MNLIRPSDHGPVVVEDGAAKATSERYTRRWRQWELGALGSDSVDFIRGGTECRFSLLAAGAARESPVAATTESALLL